MERATSFHVSAERLAFLPQVWHAHGMKFTVTPDATHRIVLTKQMRQAAGIRPGEKLEVSITPGVIILSAPSVKAKLTKKGKLTVIDGAVPDIGIAEAVNMARHYVR